ncbi:MAG TPA: helix-turn-helix domain-containing protein [Candidatus Mediterraneibacter stercoravium]|uniref:Helix-turn-helix domain-containing protein n=1 Tax=Candidatus Mediterraneibacter stercoravium TaxID=2838685 RepID=A0A9D2G952_9FIRM|nr:helix-turn-helix domain-containing protein [Candidatus Mediterraneibacter stercoravium]
MSEMLSAGKSKKEIALQLAEQGMRAPEIAKKIDAKYSTVYNWLNPDKCRPKKKAKEITVDYKNPDARSGWNADRKKCKTCRYRQAHYNPTDLNKGNCNYIEIAGHSRGCDVEDCDRYVKGTRMERKRKCTKI